MSLRAAITNAVSADALTASGAPVDWVQFFPLGEIKPVDGRKPWRIDDATHAAAIVAASLTRLGGREMPIDYDHQSDFAAIKGVGGVAPAAGWVKELSARPDGIWARIEWTSAAAQKMAAREYRYISPTFFEDQQGRVALIARAALTNNPALDLAAVASGQPVDHEESDDMLKEIALALGLPETASQADVLAAIAAGKTAQTAASGVLAEIRTAAGVSADADAPAVCAAIAALKTVGDGSDLAATVITLQGEVNALKADGARKSAEARVDEAIKAGKITPAAREVFVTMASATPAEFEKFLGVAPVLLSAGNEARSAADLDAITLSDTDRAVCAATGVAEADYLAQKKKDAA